MNTRRMAKRILTVLAVLSTITVLGGAVLYLIHPDSPSPVAAESSAVSEATNPESGAALSETSDQNPGAEISGTSAQNPDTDLSETSDQDPGADVADTPASEADQEVPDAPKPRRITLMAVGDNLMHMGVVYTGKQNDGSFDFSFLFRGISDYLDAADIKIINQETIFAGNQLGFSGFPQFNSPVEVGDGIAAAGFNVVLHATNHAADQGTAGLNYCISFWENHPEILMVGIHEKEDADAPKQIPLLTIEDTTFAILNYTYGPNMEIIPRDTQGRLDMLCAYNENSGRIDFTTLNPRVLSDIRAAKELADAVIVCPHWGTEYITKPSSYQKEFALQMTEAGADVIIGAHPHVVQPVEWIQAENGNRSLCFYSLGNFVSTQKDTISMLEGLAWVTFDVTEDGVSISAESSGVVPLVCQYTSGPVRIENIYPLDGYTEEQAAAHGIRNYGYGVLKLSDLIQWRDEIFGDAVLSPEQIFSDAS